MRVFLLIEIFIAKVFLEKISILMLFTLFFYATIRIDSTLSASSWCQSTYTVLERTASSRLSRWLARFCCTRDVGRNCTNRARTLYGSAEWWGRSRIFLQWFATTIGRRIRFIFPFFLSSRGKIWTSWCCQRDSPHWCLIKAHKIWFFAFFEKSFDKTLVRFFEKSFD